MHIHEGFLNLPTIIATNGVSLAFIIPAMKKLNKHITPKRIPLMGLSAAFVFTAQLLSFPIIGGSSVHLIGAVLISILLGPYSGLAIITSATILQALLFQHGGLLSLGANICNMGIIGCLGGYLIFKIFPKKLFLFSAGIAAFISTIIAAGFCALELGFSGTIPMKIGLISMTASHIIAGIIESVVTVSILSTIQFVRKDLLAIEKI